MVERSSPELLIPALNEYLEGLVQITFRHQGTVDKIVGDAVHVLFGAPVAQSDHAARAVACALDMDAFAEDFRRRQSNEIGFGVTRIGVNSGMAVVGNFGGESLFDYTAHGDAVNTAARLENANKYLGTRVCVSESTAALVPDFCGRPAADLHLKGRSSALRVFEPLSPVMRESDSIAAYREAFDLLECGEGGVLERFRVLAEADVSDPLATLHWKRLQAGENGVVVSLQHD
ncbi:MAG: adenylate/guanylate cyclase domain-containing protein [Gammaproteobacteria bacterium]